MSFETGMKAPAEKKRDRYLDHPLIGGWNCLPAYIRKVNSNRWVCFFAYKNTKRNASQKICTHTKYTRFECLTQLWSEAFWAQEDSDYYSASDAFIVSALPNKLIANFYLKFYKPVQPNSFQKRKMLLIGWKTTFNKIKV